MREITHVFFDLHGTLIDNAGRLARCYPLALARVLVARYGGAWEEWAEADRQIVADWDSYYADLDFGAEDGLAQMWEAETRRIRALFRLTGRPYPPADELNSLVRQYSFEVTRQCDALYADARHALEVLRVEADLTWGVISNGLRGHVEGCLVGAGVRDWFTGPIITPEDAGYFPKDAGFFELAFARAGAAAAQCVVVDDRVGAARIISRLGARGVLLNRQERHGPHSGDGRYAVLPDMSPLPDLIRQWRTQEEGS
ncbi:MAG: HAD family hydrolase [Anaerolineae bacterium]|nr:HAD family hydrolase [Anaerolineae bacterium]